MTLRTGLITALPLGQGSCQHPGSLIPFRYNERLDIACILLPICYTDYNETGEIEMNIFAYVTASFFTYDNSGMIFVRVGKYDENEKMHHFTLADRSHQALIETLDIFWPEWTDTDQQLARMG